MDPLSRYSLKRLLRGGGGRSERLSVRIRLGAPPMGHDIVKEVERVYSSCFLESNDVLAL